MSVGRRILSMPLRSGRIEKRVRLAIPVQIVSLEDPSVHERAATENVSALGVRILTQQPKALNARVVISSLAGDLRGAARIVYCQRLPDGRFGVGAQFQDNAIDWRKDPRFKSSD